MDKSVRMREDIRIENISESNIDDVIGVCSSQRLDDPVHQQGIGFKRKWLQEMISRWRTCAKVAYCREKPVAQILFHPEEADVSKACRRRDVIVIDCIYNPTPEAQKVGVGTKLLESLIHDARQHQTCLGNRSCRFIVAKVFDTGEFLPMPGFFRRRGFLPTLDDDQLWFPLTGSYEIAKPIGEYAPLEEDKNRAVVFYSPTCQFSYPFAEKIRIVIEEVLPNIKVDLIDEWERPGELIKRKGCKLVVNSKPIHTFFMETSKFKQEIERAAC